MDENKINEILKPSIRTYYDSHDFANALTEEGEYVKLKDAKQAMKDYASYIISEYIKQEIKLPEEFPYLKTQYEVGFNNAIGQVKDLNDIK